MANLNRLSTLAVASIALTGMTAAEAAVQFHTSLVERLLTGRGRYSVDYGGVQIVTKDAIPVSVTTCASAYAPDELRRTFYYSGGTAVQGGQQKQSYENIVNSAAAQGLPVTIEYDTAGCTAGYGINIISISIAPPAP